LKLKFWDWLIFLAFGCLVFFHFRGFDTAIDSTTVAPNDERQLLLFILDFRDFSCMACLDSFLGLYRILPFSFKTSKTWGILVVKNSEGEENRLFRIAEKKLKGFVQANHITFPILVDRSRIFGEWAEKGSCVLLFDGVKKILCRYDFPLTDGQFEEIFANLVF
jgi:hypothetical protein